MVFRILILSFVGLSTLAEDSATPCRLSSALWGKKINEATADEKRRRWLVESRNVEDRNAEHEYGCAEQLFARMLAEDARSALWAEELPQTRALMPRLAILLLQAHAAEQAEDLESALALRRQIRAEAGKGEGPYFSSRHVRPLRDIGRLLMRLGRRDEAQSALEAYNSEHDGWPDWQMLGDIYEEQGSWTKAREPYSSARGTGKELFSRRKVPLQSDLEICIGSTSQAGARS